jgi:ABC-type glycerol-3-phosphate transport system substrate-binding protein
MAIGAAILLLSLLPGCKEQVNPHLAPEADPEILVARTLSAAGKTQGHTGVPSATRRIKLSLNNAPSANELFEQEFVQRLVQLFEQRNPDIQIEYSTWRFTPESFYERARNRALTDIVEIGVAQAQSIIDLSYAADITASVGTRPEVQALNPEALSLVSRDGRVFGVPVELHTMALFYNRQLVDAALNPSPDASKTAVPAEKKKGKGADSEPRDFLSLADEFKEAGGGHTLIAQLRRSRNSYYDYYQQPEEEEPQGYNRRGEQEVQDYYQMPARRRSWWPFRSYYDQQEQPRRPTRKTPAPVEEQPGSEERRFGTPDDSSDLESARPQLIPGRTIDQDVITTGEGVVETVVKEDVTTVIKTAGLPQDWESFIKLAVKLTDHNKGIFGYAPVLFAREGGREFVQWGVQAGLKVQTSTPTGATLDVRSNPVSADVLNFLKDLRWRYDVSPPADKCYNDNIMKMFADGKVAMVMLPATRDTIRRLMRLGMQPDSIGIAALPGGPGNRAHLVFGRCLIVNSQLEREMRDAAVKWLLFQLDPEIARMREQYYFREQEMTGIPRVPIYLPAKQGELNTMLKPYRSLPVFADYEDIVAANLRPEPPYFTEELYEDLANSVRTVVEQKDLQPAIAAAQLGRDFEARYLNSVPTKEGLDRYLKLLTRR